MELVYFILLFEWKTLYYLEKSEEDSDSKVDKAFSLSIVIIVIWCLFIIFKVLEFIGLIGGGNKGT